MLLLVTSGTLSMYLIIQHWFQDIWFLVGIVLLAITLYVAFKTEPWVKSIP